MCIRDSINTVFSQKGSKACAPRIALRPPRGLVGVALHGHGTELVHGKHLFVQPHALLTVNNRPRRTELHSNRNGKKERREQEKPEQRTENIKAALEKAVEQIIERHTPEVDAVYYTHLPEGLNSITIIRITA